MARQEKEGGRERIGVGDEREGKVTLDNPASICGRVCLYPINKSQGGHTAFCFHIRIVSF